MVRVLVDKLPISAVQNEVRKNRINNRNTDGTFDLSKRSESKKVADDKCRLKCKSKHLVALWFATLGLEWKTGSKPASNPSLTDAIYADLSARGFEVDETTWVAYQVTLQTRVLFPMNKNKNYFSRKCNVDVFFSNCSCCALQRKEEGFEAISTSEDRVWRSQALEAKLLTPEEAICLTNQQETIEEGQLRANKQQEDSSKPNTKRVFHGNRQTMPTPQPKEKPSPAAATLGKRCLPAEQNPSEKSLDNVSKVLNMEHAAPEASSRVPPG